MITRLHWGPMGPGLRWHQAPPDFRFPSKPVPCYGMASLAALLLSDAPAWCVRRCRCGTSGHAMQVSSSGLNTLKQDLNLSWNELEKSWNKEISLKGCRYRFPWRWLTVQLLNMHLSWSRQSRCQNTPRALLGIFCNWLLWVRLFRVGFTLAFWFHNLSGTLQWSSQLWPWKAKPDELIPDFVVEGVLMTSKRMCCTWQSFLERPYCILLCCMVNGPLITLWWTNIAMENHHF